MNFNSPLMTLAGFGISVFILGGYLGGEMSRRREINREIKDIQREHQTILARMDSAYRVSVERERLALQQIDSVYVILGSLTAQEGKVRSSIKNVKNVIDRKREEITSTKKVFAEAAKISGFSLDPEN
jgi:hypothetical protein